MRRFIIACGNGSIQMVDLDSDAESEYKFCSIDDMGNNNGTCVHALLRPTTHINDLRTASACHHCSVSFVHTLAAQGGNCALRARTGTSAGAANLSGRCGKTSPEMAISEGRYVRDSQEVVCI